MRAISKDWHGMRRFRLRRLWRVNCEALMRAAGQNLKRLLNKRGWGRHPFPAEALCAFFLVFLGGLPLLLGGAVCFFVNEPRFLTPLVAIHPPLLMSFERAFFNRLKPGLCTI
jgi:hypothetical protein